MKTTTIKVGPETWEVPRGFGTQYQRKALDPAEPEVLSDLLGLIGYEVSAETIAQWPLRKRVEVEVYACNEHLRASDNPIQAHPKPEWLPEPWKGPMAGGVFAFQSGTVLSP